MVLNNARAIGIYACKLSLIIASIFFLTCCRSGKSDSTQSDWKQDGLIGSARSVRTETSKMIKQDGGYAEGPREVIATRNYDSNGNISEEDFTTADNAILYKARYDYDDDGKKVERVVLDPKGAVRAKREFKYDDKGNAVEWSEQNPDGSIRSRSSYVYNDRKAVSEWKSFNARGSLVDWWDYAYDDRGNRKEETRYFSDDTVDARYVYELDEKGNRTGMAKYNSGGEMIGKEQYVYEFDSKGNWIKRTTLKIAETNGKQESEPVEVSYRQIDYY
jgi:hypothetical protein